MWSALFLFDEESAESGRAANVEAERAMLELYPADDMAAEPADNKLIVTAENQ